MPKKQQRLTKEEFDALRPFLNTSEDRIQAAYSCMVDGLTYAEAAKPFGWSRQSVYDVVQRVWKAQAAYLESQAMNLIMPPGWEKVTLIAPVDLINKFRQEIEKASKKK